MQLNKVLKGLLIAIPVMALTACGSTSTTDAGNGGSDSTNSNQTQNSNNNGNQSSSNVEVDRLTQEQQAQEIKQKEQDQLRQQHTLYFDFDKNQVRSEFGAMLAAHAAYLVKHPAVSVMIEGHCDEHGTPEYNIALGERRAKSVASYLMTLGVSSSQIKMVSYGEEKPVDKSRTEAGFAKNRRAILVY